MKKYLLILSVFCLPLSGQDNRVKEISSDTVYYTGTLGNVVRDIGKEYVETETYAWDSDFLRYETGLTTPLSDTTRTKINDFIVMLKDSLNIDSLAEVFDVMYILANETSEAGLRNLVKRAHDATAVNSPTFTAFEGFAGNGTTSYINTNYNPNTHAVNFARNSASMGVYCRTDSPEASYSGGNGETNYVLFSLRYSGGTEYNYMYLNTDALWDRAVCNNSTGMFCYYRSAITTQGCYRNGALLFTGTDASNGVPDADIYLAARNDNGIASQFSARQYSMFYFSKSMTPTQIADFTTAFEAYMDSNSKGVIP